MFKNIVKLMLNALLLVAIVGVIIFGVYGLFQVFIGG